MYVAQHFDELQLSQKKKMDVIKYAKLSVPAVNQSMRSITIKYSQANPGLGRFTARGPSLQTVPRTVRHTISAAFYYDIDIVNCAPTLLSQYCIKHDIPTPALASYVSQRQERLTDLVKATGLDHEEAKSLVLAVLNGGRAHHCMRAQAQDTTWVRQLQKRPLPSSRPLSAWSPRSGDWGMQRQEPSGTRVISTTPLVPATAFSSRTSRTGALWPSCRLLGTWA